MTADFSRCSAVNDEQLGTCQVCSYSEQVRCVNSCEVVVTQSQLFKVLITDS